MAESSPRAAATAERKHRIRAAALACFTELGYEHATMEDIRTRAGASTGSIYHHFKSKEQLAADLYLAGLQDAQAYNIAAIRKHTATEAGIQSAAQRAIKRGLAAVPDVLKAMRSDILPRRRAAGLAILGISGKDFGYDPMKAVADSADSIKAAELWWLRNPARKG